MPADFKEETVEELLGGVRGLLADEESRAQSLNTRGGGLVAFMGIILPLSGLLAKPTKSVGSDARTASAILFALGVTLLVVAIMAVIWKVLLPSPGLTLELEEVKRYPTYEFVAQDRVMIQGRLLWGAVESLGSERARNDGKARWLKVGYVGLALGLLCMAAVASILSVEGQLNS